MFARCCCYSFISFLSFFVCKQRHCVWTALLLLLLLLLECGLLGCVCLCVRACVIGRTILRAEWRHARQTGSTLALSPHSHSHATLSLTHSLLLPLPAGSASSTRVEAFWGPTGQNKMAQATEISFQFNCSVRVCVCACVWGLLCVVFRLY